MTGDAQRWVKLDRAHCWHPFTRQAEWTAGDPLVITRGEGAWLWDAAGRRYLDGNSSIWTSIHGHAHPVITHAIVAQLGNIAHTSFLGATHPSAVELAARLCGLFPPHTLQRVFFSDNGSTAIECALKMALQYRRQTGQPKRKRFITLANGYHGDTLGAASLCGIDRFSCENGYAVTTASSIEEIRRIATDDVAAVVMEPLIQGVNEMRLWPAGMLKEVRAWCDASGVHLILDEVMTGFGRTGTMFACQQEHVIPDFLCLAKGLTGGYLPLAATLVTGDIYDAFLGDASRAFYYGHSYTANPAGCAAALASLDLFVTEQTLKALPAKAERLRHNLHSLQSRHPQVHEIRQCGFIAGIELRQGDGTRFPIAARRGEVVCLNARAHGLLTRPILDTIVLMLPLATTLEEIDFAVSALDRALSM
jgi:adenosylmethionine---8-amino-7-oxononanoate aminotransferase